MFSIIRWSPVRSLRKRVSVRAICKSKIYAANNSDAAKMDTEWNFVLINEISRMGSGPNEKTKKREDDKECS